MVDEIRANVCPYCEAPYTLAAGGCVAGCRLSELSRRLIALAAEADIREIDEIEKGTSNR